MKHRCVEAGDPNWVARLRDLLRDNCPQGSLPLTLFERHIDSLIDKHRS